MSDERELLVMDVKTGRTRPAVPQTPVLSSAGVGWKGFRLERHSVSSFEGDDFYHLNHALVVQLSAPVDVDLRWPGLRRKIRVSPGQFSVIPAQWPLSARCGQRHEFLMVSLEHKFLACAAHELKSLDRLELRPSVGVDDPLGASLVKSLGNEAGNGCPNGSAYAESLATMLAVHVARRHSGEKSAVKERRGGLTRQQLGVAMDFIHEHYSEDVTLSALAAVAGLSPYHFARLFKESTGLAPHQYLIQARVERARGLLLHSNESITAIALQVGFCDQSHFSTHFKRIYGITPRTFALQMTDR